MDSLRPAGGLLRGLLAFVERALDTPTPEPIDRTCPRCGESLRFWCREIRREGSVQEVRCLCGAHSVWDWQGAIPYLIEDSAVERERTAA